MEYFNGILQQDFNKVYTTIDNCVIVKPPYAEGRVPQTFYFDKRGAFDVDVQLDYSVIYDVKVFNGNNYYLGLKNNDIVLQNGTTQLYSGDKGDDRNFKFIYGTGVKGDNVESGTNAVSNTTDPLNIYIEDATKNWTTNAYAGMFVYVYDATTGIGQMIKIISNDATKLYIESLKGDITGGSYKIFTEFGTILYFIGHDGLYGIHNDTEIIKAKNFDNITDIEYFDQSFFSSDKNGNINKGYKGGYILYQDGVSHITTVSNIVNITSFQDYLLILGKYDIGLIRKENIIVGGDTVESYTYSLVTRDFGIYGLGSYEIYNEGLYLIDSNKKFVSLSIRSISDTKYTTEIKDNGIYIQKYLDNIPVGTLVRIYINSNEIKILNIGDSFTNFYIFDRYYNGWHKWDTDVSIYGYNNILDKYYGSDLYFINNSLDKDLSTNEFEQKINLLFGEDSITAFKNIKFQKLILGSKSTEGIIINYKITSGEDLISFPKEIKGVKILQQGLIENGASGGSLGQSILGLGLIGDDTESLEYLYPKVGTVKINLGYACELMEVTLIASTGKRIVYGGQLIGYEQSQPGLTSVKNII